MRVEFVSRGVVCLAAMPPSALNLAAFEQATGLERPQTQVVNPQLAVSDYGRARVMVVPQPDVSRVQAELPHNAPRDLCRTVARELIRQATPYALRAVGFNGFARIDCNEGEDPIRPLLAENRIADALGAPLTRAGAKLVYELDEARATLDVTPIEDDPATWQVSINRHYPTLPSDEELQRAVSWFAALNDELVHLVQRLIREPAAADEVAEHVA